VQLKPELGRGLQVFFSVEERALHHDQVIDALLLYVNANQNSKYFDSFKNQKRTPSIVPISQPNAAVYAKYIKIKSRQCCPRIRFCTI